MQKASDSSLAAATAENLLAAPLGGRREEGNVPIVDFNVFISARQLLINSSCLSLKHDDRGPSILSLSLHAAIQTNLTSHLSSH